MRGDGTPWLALEYVDGVAITAHCDERRLALPARLALWSDAAAAVAAAHRQLIIHRDLKPANVLVSRDSAVKLLDFGIAKWLEAEPVLPAAASDDSLRTHTPRYAAPEQRHGAPVTTAMDIYSLGVVLHELLTGVLPGESAGTPEIANAVLGRDLQAMLRRALRKEPGERYSSVERLADDLRRVLAQRPVQAEPARWPHRVRLFLARHRAACATSLLVVCVLAAAGALLARQQAREQAQAQRATQAREFLFELLEDAEPAAGQSAAQVTGAQMIQAALARARVGFADQPILRGNVLVELGHMLQRLDQPEQALAVLREAHALLAGTDAAGDPTVHFAEVFLAQALADGDEPTAQAQSLALAQTALAGCGSDTTRCAKVRAYAHDLLRNAANARGDGVQALQQARLALQAYQRGFGDAHVETALSWRSLAVILRNQGALREAATAIAQAIHIAQTTPLRAADGLDLRLKQALLQVDLGRYTEARRELDALLAEPARPALRAQQQRLLAQVLLGQGLLGPALAAADAASLAARQAQHAWEAALALQVQAGALSGLGQHAAAQRDITATLAGLRRLGLPEGSVPLQRASRLAAEFALRAGRLDEAHSIADALAPLAGVDQGLALELKGVLARHAGDDAGAVARHAEAATLFAAELPPEHPLRLKNAFNLALARWLAGGAGDRSNLANAAAHCLQPWPADSAWRQIPDVHKADPAVWRRVVL